MPAHETRCRYENSQQSRSTKSGCAHALALARRGEALASPNPMVGAVLVRGGRNRRRRISHLRRAAPRRDRRARSRRRRRSRRNAVRQSRTVLPHRPHRPCTRAIIAAGVARVVGRHARPESRSRRPRLPPTAQGRHRGYPPASLEEGAAAQRSLRNVDHRASPVRDAQIRDDARRPTGPARVAGEQALE